MWLYIETEVCFFYGLGADVVAMLGLVAHGNLWQLAISHQERSPSLNLNVCAAPQPQNPSVELDSLRPANVKRPRQAQRHATTTLNNRDFRVARGPESGQKLILETPRARSERSQTPEVKLL